MSYQLARGGISGLSRHQPSTKNALHSQGKELRPVTVASTKFDLRYGVRSAKEPRCFLLRGWGITVGPRLVAVGPPSSKSKSCTMKFGR